MLSPMTVLKNKVGLDGNLLCAVLDIDRADLAAYEGGEKHIPQALLTRMRTTGFIGDFDRFCNDQVEFLREKLALAQGAQKIGKTVAKLTMLEELVALTEAENEAGEGIRYYSEAEGTFDVSNVEIMAVEAARYTHEDLEQIARNFETLSGVVKPPLCLGEADQRSGLPAAGWLSRVKVLGSKLFADFSDVPRAVAEVIKRKAYKRLAVEIYPNFQAPGGERYGLAISRVSLLGAGIAPIRTLKDIEGLY